MCFFRLYFFFVVFVCLFFICYYILSVTFFFFIMQNTAYERRISDWSSDVCSSDLVLTRNEIAFAARDIAVDIDPLIAQDVHAPRPGGGGRLDRLRKRASGHCLAAHVHDGVGVDRARQQGAVIAIRRPGDRRQKRADRFLVLQHLEPAKQAGQIFAHAASPTLVSESTSPQASVVDFSPDGMPSTLISRYSSKP